MKDILHIVLVHFITWKALLVEVNCQLCGPKESYSKCTKIQTWNEFKQQIHNSDPLKPLVFCPFTIQKEEEASFVISKKVEAICQKEGQCVIDASQSKGSSILKIRGSKASIKMHGFVFENAANVYSVIHVTFGTSMDQLFCRCLFRR